jgi:hypothetical protein
MRFPPITRCITCRYFGAQDACLHPYASVDLIGNKQSINCIDARSRIGFCGPEAQFWENKELPEPGLPEQT